VVGAILVTEEDEVMLITNAGTLIRTATAGISVLGRNTQGVKLIATGDEEKLVGIERIIEPELGDGEGGELVEEMEEPPENA